MNAFGWWMTGAALLIMCPALVLLVPLFERNRLGLAVVYTVIVFQAVAAIGAFAYAVRTP